MFNRFGIDKLKKYIGELDYALSSDLHITTKGITITCLSAMVFTFIGIIVMILWNIKHIKISGNKYFGVNIFVSCIMAIYFGLITIFNLYSDIRMSIGDIIRYELKLISFFYGSYDIYNNGFFYIGQCEFGEFLMKGKILYKIINYLTTGTSIAPSGTY
jgi:hypothetical protein